MASFNISAHTNLVSTEWLFLQKRIEHRDSSMSKREGKRQRGRVIKIEFFFI